MGRINCRLYKADICKRIISEKQKMPKFLILHQNTSYEFRGNLTLEYIGNHISSRRFINHSEILDQRKDEEGLTMKNYNKFTKYKIRPKHYNPHKNLTSLESLKLSVKSHMSMLKQGIQLIAKTYGIRRFVKDEEQIFTVAMGILCLPFVVMVFVMMYDRK